MSSPDFPSLFVEGYTDKLSYSPGETAGFHISTSTSQYSIEIARLGAQRKVFWQRSQIPGTCHPVPEDASSHGCRWPRELTLEIPADWPSGYYEAILRVEDDGGQYCGHNQRSASGKFHFIVRPAHPGQRTSILLQLATNSYNAYNNWGGWSLYAYHGRGGLQGHRVSFERPPNNDYFHRWELDFVVWAERNGYDLDYATNCDLEFMPHLLKQYRLVLSVGHDEYWSAPMRDNLEAFIAGGGNTAFFSGNTVCWQVRSEDEGRALVCWKQSYTRDPAFAAGDHAHLSTLWSHHLVGRPENSLTGVGFLHGGYHLSHGQFMDGSGAFRVHRPDHWVLADTGLGQNDTFGGEHTIVGYECDGCEFTLEDGLPVPTGSDGTPHDFTILCTAPARWHANDCEWYDKWKKGHSGAAVLGLYNRGGTVFTAGTTDWAHGLAGGDPIVERITRNVIDRLSTTA